ncbi:MAG: hypothetical protein AUK53_10800 [Betaproteobacteria bacterium CG2_30_59_46]|nr:MAG: hypothetical protein AUK53_10800 [Betaproteobacteria bacterium CG2_30_59_46]PIY01413.1 MAG: hypothetical protein COZ23_03330 [Hydrogenophilales bacterium CG_4_10_14_3_um_filter_58_23]
MICEKSQNKCIPWTKGQKPVPEEANKSMANNSSPQPASQAKPDGSPLLNWLLRPSLGRKFGIIFLLVIALTVGNLIVVERLYDGIVNTTTIVNESGRLRYLSQEIAFYSARLAYEKRQDGDLLGQSIVKFEKKLGKLELDVRQLSPIVVDETGGITRSLLDLREAWRSYRSVVDLIRNSPEEIDASVAVSRLAQHSAVVLGIADAVVNELDRVSVKAHSRVDSIQRTILVLEVAFILTILLYLRYKVILPVREMALMASRFAAGDRSARISIKSRDEIGGLARNFNRTAEMIARLIDDLNLGIVKLEQSQEKVSKLAMVVEGTGNSVVITDLNGIIEYVNPAFTKVTGYLLEEAVGQKPGVIKSSLTSPEHYQKLWKRLLAGEEWRGEMLNRKKNGELLWEYEVITALKNEAGEITHFVAIKEDVTERKRQEEKLRLWERAIEASFNAILITDATHPGNPLIYANPAFERITGYSQEEALGRNCGFLQNDDHDQPEVEELRRAIREQREGRAVLRNYRKDGSMFWNELLVAPVRDEAGKVTHFVGIQNDVTERKRYESQLEHQANYDTLTGLPNRNLLQDRLGQTLAYVRRHERELALLFIDLDYFKNINDSLGHNAGDRLLKLVAVRLAGCVREGDTVSRQGGDEFVVILSDVAAEEDATLVTQKILHAMSEPFDVDGRELYVTCSIGIALYPKDGGDSETLLKNADAALYRAKDLGRNNAQFYAAEMNLKAMERLTLEDGLRHALEHNEFVVHYQPQVDLRTGEIIGMEALVRWQHPEQGLVSPARFIPVAEESGLIVPLGEWVLRTACIQNKAWQRAGLRPISVAVNLSARQFRQPNLVEVVVGILRETGLDPAHLELEVTESLVMQNVEVTIATLGRLKAMGIKLSIDDFGTGYSSLSYLKRFPIDTLKIDQSFVRDITTDPDDAAIAKTIISMAHDLQLRVIAEGVETEEQKSFLQQRHCDEMQGYFFSRPVPAEDFEVLLRERKHLQMADSTAALGQRTLLLLDDEENILTSLTRLLRRDGYHILKATSAAAAFELLAGHPVGVIISDQRMPEMNGTEFLHRVKQIYPDTVRMVLSGYTDLKSVTDAINEGAVYRFLTKPWDDDLLRANVQEAFQRYELVQDNQRLSDEMASINEALNRAKRELEKRVKQKTGEARHNVGVLQISQEMLEYLPVGVIGVGEDGLIAVANRKANELFDAENTPPLVGSLAAERLSAAMIECLAGAGERRVQGLENGRNVMFWSHAMGASSGSAGRVLVIVPNEQDGD